MFKAACFGFKEYPPLSPGIEYTLSMLATSGVGVESSVVTWTVVLLPPDNLPTITYNIPNNTITVSFASWDYKNYNFVYWSAGDIASTTVLEFRYVQFVNKKLR